MHSKTPRQELGINEGSGRASMAGEALLKGAGSHMVWGGCAKNKFGFYPNCSEMPLVDFKQKCTMT